MPVLGVREEPPLVHPPAEFVDKRGRVVLLLLGGQALSFVKDELVLGSGRPVLLGLGNGGDELIGPARLNDLLGGLPGGVQFPMPPGYSYGELRMGRSKKSSLIPTVRD